MKTKKTEPIKGKEIVKDCFYDLLLRIKLTPDQWKVLPYFYRNVAEDNICLFRFDWLFFVIELQRWEKLTMVDFEKWNEKNL